MTTIRRITVFGLGYIGLPTAAVFANAGFEVIGVDVRNDVVSAINSGTPHISEAGLDRLVSEVVRVGSLRASALPSESDAFVISVPTPLTEEKRADLRYVEDAVQSICKVLRPGNLIVLESTVPPRTCIDRLAPLIQSLTGLVVGRDYDLAYCPERVIPGNILHEIVNNDRIVGGATQEATVRTVNLYKSFVKGEVLHTDTLTAEMCKLMENTYRDVNIALANELSVLAENVGVNISDAISLANRHPRVNIHQPGIGVGGHCIPIDPWFLIEGHPEEAGLMRQARYTNDARPNLVATKVCAESTRFPAHSIVFMGLTYKRDVDDLRESPAIDVVTEVKNRLPTREIFACDPFVEKLPTELVALGVRPITLEDVARTLCLAVVLVPHTIFTGLELLPLSVPISQSSNWSASTPTWMPPAG